MKYGLIVALLFAAAGFGQTIKDTSPRQLASLTFAELGAPGDGTIAYCRDCATANPVTAGGTGTVVERTNGQWVAKQASGFLAAGTGAVSRPLTAKMQEVISVMDFGAKGDGSANDTTAISNAIAAACATPYAPRVVFPSPVGSYIVTSSLTLCSAIDVFGYGHAIIDYSGTGALFQFTASPIYHPTIHGLTIRGTNTSGQIGILLQGITAASANFYDLNIYQFGDAATHTGAGIELVNTDSASMSITNVEFSNNGDAIYSTNSTMDGLNVAENHMGGTGYCARIEGGNGAGAVRITHNVMTCGKGGLRYNPTFGLVIVDHNEHEAVGTITDTNGAVFSFLAGLAYVNNNLCNSNGHGVYDFYVGNNINYSAFTNNVGGASTSAVFFVGTGTGNAYAGNNSIINGATNSPLYSTPPPQTWTSDVDAATHKLGNLGGIGIGAAAVTGFPIYMIAPSGTTYAAYLVTNGAALGVVTTEQSPTAAGGFEAVNDAGHNASFTVPGSAHAATTLRNLGLFNGDVGLGFGVAGSVLAYLTSTGLGVKNPAPAYPLDVTGDLNITGAFRKGGAAGVTKTCSTPITGITVVGGIITSITCP